MIIGETLVIVLIDQHIDISYKTFNECINISENTSIRVISFGCNLLNGKTVPPEVHTCVVTDLTSAVKAVMNQYK